MSLRLYTEKIKKKKIGICSDPDPDPDPSFEFHFFISFMCEIRIIRK